MTRSQKPMLILPALVFPLVLALALQRLYRIPTQLWRAEVHVCPQRHGLWVMVCSAAYLALAGCTVLSCFKSSWKSFTCCKPVAAGSTPSRVANWSWEI